MAPTLYTQPSSVPVARSEKIPVAVDFSQLIVGSDAITSPTSALYDQDGTTVSLADAPTLNADMVSVQQIIRGSALSAARTYRLDVTCVLNPNKTVTASVNI